MNILMTKSWQQAEYLDDSLLHGLRSLYGNSVIDAPVVWPMYKDSFGPGKRELTSIVGRGYSLYASLEDHDIDRSDIETKIRTGFFDLIIMHSWYLPDNLQHILEHTPSDRIVWLDGRDEREIKTEWIGKGHYFKRELVQPTPGVLPISFGFPKEKIQDPLQKTRAVAHCVAGDTSTYIFKTEEEYYRQYNEALFGITKCKGGWDCMRHYEIMASRCVPWFVDLEGCPETTCTTLPKTELWEARRMIETYGIDNIPIQEYENLRQRMHAKFTADCTTEALAKYVVHSAAPSHKTYHMPLQQLRTSADMPGLCIPWDWRSDDPNNPDINIIYQRACTTPSDVVEHVSYLNLLAQDCKHITEIGVRFGTTSTAFINSKAKLRSYDIYVQPEARQLFDVFRNTGRDIVLYEQSSLAPSLMEPTDMLFIDGLHTYQQVKEELALWSHWVRKYIVLHDTVTYAHIDQDQPNPPQGTIQGLMPALNQFLETNGNWRIRAVFYNNNGLTVIERLG